MSQSDEYRTEPPFKLQGSYHYRSEAQTLTVGAEANLLKLDELLGKLEGPRKQRWDEIKRTFDRNQLLRGAGAEDRMGQIVAQLSAFGQAVVELRKTIQAGIEDKALES